MDSNREKEPDPAGTFDEKRNGSKGTYNGRTLFYGALLLFIVAAGLPIAGIPALRHRLLDRAQALYRAYAGDTGPVTAELDAQQQPYPEEYKRAPSEFPNPGQGTPEDWIFNKAKEEFAKQPDSSLALITPKTAPTNAESDASREKKASGDTDSGASDSDTSSWYSKGESEQNAYDLVIKSYPKVAGMVEGSDSSLKFISWGGMKRADDEYWIRLLFKTGEGLEEEFIWDVNLKTKKVTPLSHNARSIS